MFARLGIDGHGTDSHVRMTPMSIIGVFLDYKSWSSLPGSWLCCRGLLVTDLLWLALWAHR